MYSHYYWMKLCLTSFPISLGRGVDIEAALCLQRLWSLSDQDGDGWVLPCSILPMSNWIHFLLWWLQIQTFSLFLIDNPQKLWEYLQYDHSQYVIYCSILLSFCSWTLDSGTIYQSTPLDQEVSLNSYRSILIQTEAVTFLMTHDSSFVLRWIL